MLKKKFYNEFSEKGWIVNDAAFKEDVYFCGKVVVQTLRKDF